MRAERPTANGIFSSLVAGRCACAGNGTAQFERRFHRIQNGGTHRTLNFAHRPPVFVPSRPVAQNCPHRNKQRGGSAQRNFTITRPGCSFPNPLLAGGTGRTLSRDTGPRSGRWPGEACHHRCGASLFRTPDQDRPQPRTFRCPACTATPHPPNPRSSSVEGSGTGVTACRLQLRSPYVPSGLK